MAYITIDLDDVIDQASDEELIAELKRRKADLGDDDKEVVKAAIRKIMRGDTLDGVTELERHFFPKWVDPAQVERAVKEALSH